jgi:hypothetical protein
MMPDPAVHNFLHRGKACPECGSTDHLTVRNYDSVWRDGEVWCSRCEVFVRNYDAG